MERQKFEQMAKDYNEFIAHIQRLSGKFASINKINDPLHDWDPRETWCDSGEIIFLIDENGITINFAEDENNYCGSTDYEQKNILIPSEFFDESTHDAELLVAAEREAIIADLDKKLLEKGKAINTYNSGEQQIRKEMYAAEELARKYDKLTFEKSEFMAEIGIRQSLKAELQVEVAALMEEKAKYQIKGS